MWTFLIDILASYLLFRKGGRPASPMAIVFFILLVFVVVIGAIVVNSDAV